MLGVDLDGSRRIEPAHVGCLVGPDGSRRIQSDRLDDQTDDQGPSDTKSDAKGEQPEARWQSRPHRHRWLVRLFQRASSYCGRRPYGTRWPTSLKRLIAVRCLARRLSHWGTCQAFTLDSGGKAINEGFDDPIIRITPSGIVAPGPRGRLPSDAQPSRKLGFSTLRDRALGAVAAWCQVRVRRSWTMSVAAVGVPLTNPKKGPKSRVAVNPGRYRPDRLVPNASSSTGKPSVTWIRSRTPAR